MNTYEMKILDAIVSGTIELEPGKIQRVRVLHDSECLALSGKGECNCDPEVEKER